MLGIDLGGTAIKWVMLSSSGRIAAAGRLPTPHGRDEVVATLARIMRESGAQDTGIGLPGHVDRATGVVRFLPNLAGDWADYPLADTLFEATGRKPALLNDARAFCLAELRLGAARGETDAFFLTLGTGVGGGIVTGGCLLTGPDDRLGEIGHMTYDPSGPRCGCGGRGCLETFASAPAIMRNAGTDTIVGEPKAVAALELAGKAIGDTVASLAAVIPCRALVVGGGVAGALPLLRPCIEAALAVRREFIGPIRVAGAELGEDAGAVGAALIGMEGRSR